MRCSKYNIGNKLPMYIEKDGNMNPCIQKNFDMLGVLVRIDAVPETGKTITISHGEIIADKWTEIIDEQKTPEEIATAAALSVNIFSKLEIRRAMRALGKESNLNTLLSNVAFGNDWNDAVEIDLSDETTQLAITAYGGDIDEIKLKIAGL